MGRHNKMNMNLSNGVLTVRLTLEQEGLPSASGTSLIRFTSDGYVKVPGIEPALRVSAVVIEELPKAIAES